MIDTSFKTCKYCKSFVYKDKVHNCLFKFINDTDRRINQILEILKNKIDSIEDIMTKKLISLEEKFNKSLATHIYQLEEKFEI